MTYKPIYPSSLWITNKSHISCAAVKSNRDHHKNMKGKIINNIAGYLRILCKKRILIGEECSISMNAWAGNHKNDGGRKLRADTKRRRDNSKRR